MGDSTIRGVANAPAAAKSQWEVILDEGEKFIKGVDLNKVMKALRIILKLAMIIFPRFVPMTDAQQNNYNNITGAANDILNPK